MTTFYKCMLAPLTFYTTEQNVVLKQPIGNQNYKLKTNTLELWTMLH